MTYAMITVIVVSIVTSVASIKIALCEKKRRIEAEFEASKAKSDLNCLKNMQDLKNEIYKKSKEKTQKLNSGDVHSRNSAAADILRNNN